MDVPWWPLGERVAEDDIFVSALQDCTGWWDYQDKDHRSGFRLKIEEKGKEFGQEICLAWSIPRASCSDVSSILHCLFPECLLKSWECISAASCCMSVLLRYYPLWRVSRWDPTQRVVIRGAQICSTVSFDKHEFWVINPWAVALFYPTWRLSDFQDRFQMTIGKLVWVCVLP